MGILKTLSKISHLSLYSTASFKQQLVLINKNCFKISKQKRLASTYIVLLIEKKTLSDDANGCIVHNLAHTKGGMGWGVGYFITTYSFIYDSDNTSDFAFIQVFLSLSYKCIYQLYTINETITTIGQV